MVLPDDVDGVPLEDLTFDEVEWTDDRRQHVEDRAARKGTQEYEPRVEWATEACGDPHRLVARTASAVVVVGWSNSARRLLRVALTPKSHAAQGRWYGLTAHAAGARDRRAYEEEP